jgi:hypothetical protein
MNTLSHILKSCRYVSNQAKHVHINETKLDEFVTQIEVKDLDGLRKGVAWDAEGWHYAEDTLIVGPLTCQYIFVMDSLNFCFWPSSGLEYEHLAVCLRQV